MKVIVQKYGGTSVADQDVRKKAIAHIKDAVANGYKVVVVVSAMGRFPDAYATDALFSLVDGEKTMITKRESDLLLSCGEIISAVVFSNQLKQEKLNATSLTGGQAGIMTTADFTEAKIIDVDTTRLKKELLHVDVVVVAGFQGKTVTGDVTTLGRGGSDTSACAIGASIQAEYVDIFTDVDGIKTADPRLVKNAETLESVGYQEMVNLAYQGAKVIHPRAVEIAMQNKLLLRVRSTSSKNKGTRVTHLESQVPGRDIKDQLVTGIAHMTGLTQIKIEGMTDVSSVHNDVFSILAGANISVDFINMYPEGLRFTVRTACAKEAVEKIKSLGLVPIRKDHCAKVSVVGAGICGVPGVTAKLVKSLYDQKIDILQSADSHLSIWVLVKEEAVHAAVNAVHNAFFKHL